ncbi:hypothetical protein AVEN_201460-1 [Araneus ventricosus]|uniref:Uncharacterized protein n=1 Tax=Araneus ventricosus TaxID=182803 RepID=A0A4Y2NTP8_ARAVE|nr:hypothetical protein AVEN_201460-1 [Araneus ventricosus]
MFHNILPTLLTGMSKVRGIPRASYVPKALLDASCNAVATSSTDVEAIAFLPLPHFTSNEPDSSNLSVIVNYNHPVLNKIHNLWKQRFVSCNFKSGHLHFSKICFSQDYKPICPS